MYKSSRELKREAKDALKGRWGEAVALNLVPSIIQIVVFLATVLIAIGIIALMAFMMDNGTSYTDGANPSYMYADWSESYADPTGGIITSLISISFMPFFGPILNLLMMFVFVGISFTFLDVIRKGNQQEMKFKNAFRLFNGVDFIPIFLINLIIKIFTALWSFLFVIPGIIKTYSYSQANFIYKDLSSSRDIRNMGATSFISESRELMRGHKLRLFWLDLTFIGWYIVGLLTFCIGFLWINPYINATKSAFYDNLSNGKFLEVEELEEDDMWTSF